MFDKIRKAYDDGRLTFFHFGSLIAYFDSQGAGENRNLGFEFMPICFWRHIHFYRTEIGYDNKRICIGVGIFSIFWDYAPKSSKKV